VLGQSLLAAQPDALAIGTGPSLQVNAPGQVNVGEPIQIVITAHAVADIAGYQTELLYDTSAVTFDGLHQRQNDLRSLGRDIGPLEAVELPEGLVFGPYSCSVPDCTD